MEGYYFFLKAQNKSKERQNTLSVPFSLNIYEKIYSNEKGHVYFKINVVDFCKQLD